MGLSYNPYNPYNPLNHLSIKSWLLGEYPPYPLYTSISPGSTDLCSQAFLATAGQEHLPGKNGDGEKKGRSMGKLQHFFLKSKSTCVSFYVISVDCWVSPWIFSAWNGSSNQPCAIQVDSDKLCSCTIAQPFYWLVDRHPPLWVVISKQEFIFNKICGNVNSWCVPNKEYPLVN